MSAIDLSNEIFTIAADLVNQSNRNIFLTGKAGTGKTTFLRYIKEHCLKETAIVAPTGVAAINAGGATIHSFFQLPFSPFLPEARGNIQGNDANNRHTLFGKMKINRERIKVLRQLELLIIDEISMVRCDLLDSIDAVLRHFRNRHTEPFGGVQVLLIGDMYQLPPVTVDHEWNLLSQFYSSPYFFDSRVIQQSPPVFLEFEKIYRQSDQRFIDLLNQVRNNNLSAEGKKILGDLCKPGEAGNSPHGHIILTTHNYKADAINAGELSRLKTKQHTFKASIEGDFNEKAYPADEMLLLKEGAQVMFIKNDKDREKRYYNGKIGTVSRISEDGIYVQCKDEPNEIEVSKEVWENIRYSVNKSNNQLEEDVVGSFKQYPLRLAWAITIHKSQGLTFDKAVIDAGDAFATGQVYVALSRCTSLEGIILESRINDSSLRTDERIVAFAKNFSGKDSLKEELQQSKKIYQQNVLLSVFDLMTIIRNFNELKELIIKNDKDYNEAAIPWLNKIEERLIYLQSIADKFKAHLNNFFLEPVLPQDNPALQDRLKNAAQYFIKEVGDVLQLISSLPVVTESKLQAKNFNDQAKELYISIAEKQHLIKAFHDGFSLEKYYYQKKHFTVPPIHINTYATTATEHKETPHPELHYKLRELRNKICEQRDAPIYLVANGKTIDEMVMYLPQTPEELMKISGFGKAKVDQFGKQFLDIIIEYANEHGLQSLIHEKNPKREKKQKEPGEIKTETKTLTYELHTQGKTITEIAAERKLTPQTIEGHLAFYVSKGIISIEALVPQEKLVLIDPLIETMTDKSITPIKEKLGNAVSFGEIRLAIAAKEWEKIKATM